MKLLKNSLFAFCCLIILTGCLPDNQQFKTYVQPNPENKYIRMLFVKPDGSDTNDGLSPKNAFKTISQALNSAAPGSKISVMPGTYNEEILIDSFGTDKAPTIIAGGGGGIPVLDGQGKRKAAFRCNNCNNIIFENLEIKNYTDFGIGAQAGSKIAWRNLIVHDNGFDPKLETWFNHGYGLIAEAVDELLVQNNVVFNNGPKQIDPPARVLGTGINTKLCQNTVIIDNTVYQNIGGGISVDNGKKVLIDNNQVYKNNLDASTVGWWDGGVWVNGGQDITLSNNNIHDNMGPGIQLSDKDEQKPTGYKLERNISKNNYYGAYLWNFGTDGLPDESVLYASQNLFTNNSKQDVIIHDWGYDENTLK